MERLITLNSITKKYSTTVALNGITLDFPKTGMIFIKGKSGCGKTTLLNLLGGLDDPTEGTIIFDGKHTTSFSQREWDDYRNRFIGFVFQDYNLLDGMTVEENIEFALNIQDELQSAEDKKRRVQEMLHFVGLQDFEMRKVTELSGGQKQRVAIARAIAKQSKVILADEPTGNLDTESSKLVHSLLKKVSTRRLVIIVTHDIVSAMEYGDRIITISDGKITEDLELDNANSSQHRYSITVTDESDAIAFSLKSEPREKAKDLLSTWLISQKKNHKYSFDIQEEQPEAFPEQEVHAASAVDINAKELSFLQRFGIAGANLAPKKVRLVFTTIMFSLTIFLLLIISFVLTYDRTETIGRYLTDQNANEVYLVERKSYENLFFEEQENYISKGEKYYNKLSDLFPELEIIPRLQVDLMMLAESAEDIKIASEVTLIITDQYDILQRELVSGRYPTNENEIVITDYVAKYLLTDEEILNKTISIDNQGSFQVVGIIGTDCVEKQIALKVNRNTLNEFEQSDLQNIYQVAITGTGYYDLKKSTQSSIQLSKSDFFISDMESRYLQSVLNFGSQNLITENLLFGRMPQSEDEVLISSEMALREQIEGDDLGQRFMFIDIYASGYCDTYSDTINLYGYFRDGVSVVGVYDSGSLSTQYLPDVLIDDEIYQDIMEKNLRYYDYRDYMLITGGSDAIALTKCVDANGLLFQEPAISKIYQFQQILDSLSSIVVIFFIVVILITFLMLNTYISNNIKVNAKKIGVLKALGITTGQISTIFLIETIIISVVSYLISSTLTVMFIRFVNTRFIDQIPGHEFEYLYWNWGMAVFVAILSVGLSMCSAVLPIVKLAGKKPVEIIRSDYF